MIDCTRTNITLVESNMLMYVEALHSFTHVTAAPSVSCFEAPCGSRAFLIESINCRYQILKRQQVSITLYGLFGIIVSIYLLLLLLTIIAVIIPGISNNKPSLDAFVHIVARFPLQRFLQWPGV